MLEVHWSRDEDDLASLWAAVQVEPRDRHRLLAYVTQVLSGERVSILSATVTTTRDRVALSRFTFEMATPEHLDHIIKVIRKIDGVYDAYRLTGTERV